MKKSLPAVFFLVISLFLILIWFRGGHLFAGGDVGFQALNPQRVLENARYTWWDATAPGSAIPQGLSAIPFQLSLSLLQNLGFPPVAVQATLFFVLLFVMGFGMYLFLIDKLKEESRLYPFLGGLFYMFNPYMMIQVWHRFIHTTIILAAVLPFFAIFWDKWIKKGSIKNLMLFLLTNLLAVYIYGTYAYIITVWIFLFFITITSLTPWEGRVKLLQVSGKFLFGFIIWILINCWWLVPVTQISPALLSVQHKSADSLINLIMISGQAILPYSLQLINPFYPFYQAEFGSVYKNTLLQLIPLIFVTVILIGLIRSFKSKTFSLFGIFFLLAAFLAKGGAPPFGALYIFGFKNSFALGVLRNPFEKTGLILVFFATVLFVLGIQKLKNRLIILVVLISVLVFSWPMLLGKTFGSVERKGDVEVPQSYKMANEWLKEQRTKGVLDGNILHLPLTRGESVRYNWEFGYNGLESSDQFFTSHPSISRGFNVQRTDDALTALSLVFRKSSEDSNKILKLLQNFNVRFLVLHRDLSWQGTDIDDPLEVEKVLNKLYFIEKKGNFGELVIFQVTDRFFGPKIEIQNSVSIVNPHQVNMGIWPWLGEVSNNFFVSPFQSQKIDSNIKSQVQEMLIFPQNAFVYPEASGSSLGELTEQLSSHLNNLASTVSYMKQLGLVEPITEKLAQNIILSSNKLVEAYNQQSFLAGYNDLINSILPEVNNPSIVYIERLKNDINDVLKIHELFLSLMQKRLNGAEQERVRQSQDKIREFLKKESLLPYFAVTDQATEVGQRQYYNLWVDWPGEYELVLTDAKTKDNYIEKFDKIDFQINGQQKALSGYFNGNLVSFGLIDLNQGLNEISILNPSPLNLVVPFENLTKFGDIKLSGDQIQMIPNQSSPAIIESPLEEIGGGDIYQVSFTGQIPTNVSVYLQIVQDSDPVEQGNKIPRISVQVFGNQSGSWQNYKLRLSSLSAVTQKASFRLAVVPINLQAFSSGSTLIKNLRVIRVFNNNIFLRSDIQSKEVNEPTQTVKFTKINPVAYEGTFDLRKPGFLFFKETYHSGWKLQLTDESKTFIADNHYLGLLYGNAWYIEGAGKYKFKIIFDPEKSFYYGMILSGIGLFGLLSYAVVIKKLKK